MANRMYNAAFKPDFFAGQTVVITGGGSGIGRCTVHELASLGVNVVLIGRNVNNLAKNGRTDFGISKLALGSGA